MSYGFVGNKEGCNVINKEIYVILSECISVYFVRL